MIIMSLQGFALVIQKIKTVAYQATGLLYVPPTPMWWSPVGKQVSHTELQC